MKLLNLLHRFLVLATALFVILSPSVSIHAISAKDRKAVINDTVFYDAEDTTTYTCASSGSTVLTGNDNFEKAYNFFVGKGLQPFQSAGIVGNLIWESGGELDPKQNQNGGGPGRGIAQWTVNQRWAELQKWAAGRDIYDLGTQLDYVWYEMNQVSPWKQSLPAVKATGDLTSATRAFMDTYEKPGVPHFDERVTAAQGVLNLYGNGAPANTGTATENTAAGGCGGTGGLGVNGDFTFPLQTNQAAITGNKPAWCYTSQTSCHHDYRAADIMIGEGTPVVAAVSGTVFKADDVTCNGTYNAPRVQILGSDGKYYYYTHMRPGSIQVQKGATIQAGQQLGVVGPRLCAQNTDTHLHFQMSSVPVASTESASEQAQYIDPQPNLTAAFAKLPAK